MPEPAKENARPATYDMRRKEDGTWTVYTVATGLPAVVNGVPQVGKDVEDADNLVDLLHRLEDRGAGGDEAIGQQYCPLVDRQPFCTHAEATRR